MGFQVGDKVIHGTFGMGEIIQIEDINLQGRLTTCYTVQIDNLTIWIPIDKAEQHSLRLPSTPEEFSVIIAILSSPGEELPADRQLRADQLMTQIKDGQLDSICRAVRDLNHFQRVSRLNDKERYILDRGSHSLLTEWAYSSGISLSQAQQQLTSLLNS
jgi:RNA polymerase-interacting CarD/CdnL/TRCF family regulator